LQLSVKEASEGKTTFFNQKQIFFGEKIENGFFCKARKLQQFSNNNF
jgi:hypothetical protein